MIKIVARQIIKKEYLKSYHALAAELVAASNKRRDASHIAAIRASRMREFIASSKFGKIRMPLMHTMRLSILHGLFRSLPKCLTVLKRLTYITRFSKTIPRIAF